MVVGKASFDSASLRSGRAVAVTTRGRATQPTAKRTRRFVTVFVRHHTSVASIAGPPWTSAVTQTAIKAPEVPMRRTWPAPKRPTRTACSSHAADGDRGKHRPRKEGFAAAGGPDHDGRRQHDPGDTENGELQAKSDGKRQRRLLIRLVANAGAVVGIVGLHDVTSRKSDSGAVRRTGRCWATWDDIKPFWTGQSSPHWTAPLDVG